MLQRSSHFGAGQFPNVVCHEYMSLVEAEQTARRPAISGILDEGALVAARFAVPVRLTEGVRSADRKAAGETLVELRLEAVIERVAVTIEIANGADRLDTQLRRRRIVELLEWPPRLNIRIG